MGDKKITAQKKKEGRGLLLIILASLHLLFLCFMWVFMLGSQQSFSFIEQNSFMTHTGIISALDDFLLNASIMYIPIFTSIAILSLKKIGVYILILCCLAAIQIEVLSWITTYSFQYNSPLMVQEYYVVSVFWVLYFYAIKRKWHLFS